MIKLSFTVWKIFNILNLFSSNNTFKPFIDKRLVDKISAGLAINYSVISRLHPALLKPEILYSLLRNRIIDEIKRRQSLGKDPVKHGVNQDNTGRGQPHLQRHPDRTKPYYAPTVSLKKYMLRKAGTKYGLRVQRKSDDIQKLPLFVSVMKNRFHGIRRKRDTDKTLDLMEIYFKRMGRLEKDKKKPKYRIICHLSCFIQRVN